MCGISGSMTRSINQFETAAPLASTPVEQAALYYWRATAEEAMGQKRQALQDWSALLALPASAASPEWLATARQKLADAATPTLTPTVRSTPMPRLTLTSTRKP